MGGKEKPSSSSSSSLGRALVRQHNQMVQQSKDKGAVLRKQNKKVLTSYTETTDIEAVIEQADEEARVHSLSNPTPTLRMNTEDGSVEERRERQRQEEALYAASLRVPRRPNWTSRMTVEELDANEKQAFLEWRRSLARVEENEKLVLTPFEKNLDIWRQLWRVLERSDLLVMVVDSRNPLFYRCPDLEAYAREIDEHKKTLLLVNKADLLPSSVRKKWAKYFQQHGILFLFWSAKAASASLDGKRLSSPWKEQFLSEESALMDEDVKIYSRDELLACLQAEAEAIVGRRDANKNDKDGSSKSSHGYEEDLKKPVVVGFVGYPNVGKSSTINALVGEKKTGVTSTPGKTKHFQTLVISDKLILCDCPGLVFPSFSSSRYEMIASGVLPVDRMTEHREAIQVVANRVPRHILEGIYNISLPKPKPYELQSRPPLASELLRTYCSSRGYVGSSGLPDETKAARIVLKDYIDGKLPHFEMPSGITDEMNMLDGSPNLGNLSGDQVVVEASMVDGSSSLSSLNDYQSAMKVVDTPDELHNLNDDQISSSDSDDTDDCVDKPDIHHLLNDLESFDTNYGLSSSNVVKKKSSPARHKHHKKTQRKKDRSWRVGNDGGDGMPVVKVFQKSPIPTSTYTKYVT